MYHNILERQIRKYLGNIGMVPPNWLNFLKAVNDTYKNNDEDRKLIERTLEINSQELTENYKKLFSVVKNLAKAESLAHLGNWEYDPKQKKMFWSVEMYHLLGYEKENFLPTFAVFLTHFENKNKTLFKKLLKSNSQSKAACPMEISVLRLDKQWRIFSLVCDFQYGANGSLEKMFGSMQDVTEIKTAQEKLQRANERFEKVTQSVGAWVWEVDSQGKYIYSSAVAEQILGYKPEEIVEKKYFYDFFPTNEKEKMKKLALAAFQKKEPIKGLINNNIHKNGSLVILETNGFPVVNKTGELIGYIGSDIDVTFRIKNEQETKSRSEEMERINKVMVGRELRIIELKAKLKDLQAQLEKK